MPTLREVRAQIQRLKGLGFFIVREEIKELPNVLLENEQVENLIMGFYMDVIGILFATGKRLIFIGKGVINLRVDDFPYDKINSIQHELGWSVGKLIILSFGKTAVIDYVDKNQIQVFAAWLRAKISANGQNQIQTSHDHSQTLQKVDDTISKLERLAKLKEQGVLTQKEFDEQKAKLLAQ